MDEKRTANIFKSRILFAALLFGLILLPAAASYAKEYYLVPRLVQSSHVLRLGDFIANFGRDDSDRLLDPFPVHLESPSVVSADIVRKALEDTGRREFILVGTHCLFVPESGKSYQDNYFRLLTFFREELAVELGWAEVSAEPEQLEKITDQTVFLAVEEIQHSYAGYSSRFRHPTHTVRFRQGGSAAIDTAEITIQRYVPGLKAVRRIEANRKIETEDVRQAYVAWKNNEDPPAQIGTLENGIISRTAVSHGETIFTKDIKKETIMESGSRISIHIKKGTITMRLEGVVYGSGGLGDRVRVKPVRAERSLYGKIISRREVIVEGL